MWSLTFRLAVCSSVLSAAAATPAMSSMLALGDFGLDLYDLDPGTWTTSNRRAIRQGFRSTPPLSGLDYAPDGVLWIHRDEAEPSPLTSNGLYHLDPQSGLTQLVAATAYCSAFDMDFDPTSGLLYALRRDAGNSVFCRLDTATGARTDLATLGQDSGRWALMINAAGAVYVMNHDDGVLLCLDKHTGSILSSISAALPYVDAPPSLPFDFFSVYRLKMEYDPVTGAAYIFGFWNNLYRAESRARVYSLDVQSGAITELSATSLGILAVTAIPEPACLLLMTAALASFVHRGSSRSFRARGR